MHFSRDDGISRRVLYFSAMSDSLGGSVCSGQRHSLRQEDRFKTRCIDRIVFAEQLQPQLACQEFSPIERELEVPVSRGRDGDQLE